MREHGFIIEFYYFLQQQSQHQPCVTTMSLLVEPPVSVYVTYNAVLLRNVSIMLLQIESYKSPKLIPEDVTHSYVCDTQLKDD